MATKKYWKGLDELNQDAEFLAAQQNEFAEPLPVDKFLGESELEEGSTSRRDFLKLMGFSVAAASLAACETPVNKAIPYVVKPEEITPGVANWYASTFYDGNDYAAVLVKTREGRPIKVEGNELSQMTKGAGNARIQASVLSLYDDARIKEPYKNGSKSTWAEVDKDILAKLQEASAKGGVRILSSTIISPATKAAIAEFTAKYGAKHIQYDAISYSGLIKANEMSFGKAIIPSYKFDKAMVVVSIGADFLANWLSSTEFVKQYSSIRKVTPEKPEMSKHFQFEATLSLTGANADVRTPVKPSDFAAVATNLYNELAKLAGFSTIQASKLDPEVEASVKKAAQELTKNRRNSIVVCGSNDQYIQVIVNGINSLLDNYEGTIDLTTPLYTHQGDDQQFVDLVNEMNDGKVAALITYNTNPVYTAPASLKFAEAYKKVGLRVSLAERLDETAEQANYVCPDHHYLESWNDFQPKKGYYSLAQPTIVPIFSQPRFEGTRQAQDSILKWAGNNSDYYSYLKAYWQTNLFPLQSSESNFTAFWNQTVHDGVFHTAGAASTHEAHATEGQTAITAAPVAEEKHDKHKDKEVKPAPIAAPVAESKNAQLSIAEAAAKVSKMSAGKLELALYQKVGIGSGNQANNPWLQELPDPISRATWDNYITMSPIDIDANKFSQLRRGDNEGNVVNLTVNGVVINSIPVFPQPGQTPGTIGLALGYGRSEKTGRVAFNIGKNAYPLIQWINGTFQYSASDVSFTATAEKHEFACTQSHNTIMGREEQILRETSLNEYKANPRSGNPVNEMHTYKGHEQLGKVDLWAAHDRSGNAWGLQIDLSACIGCGSCVVSCTAENNVAVVGKDQVKRTREMHWIRIDRYYSSDMTREAAHEKHVGAKQMYLDMEIASAKNPKVTFQPMMCQHCNHAPCETVCPVLATSHSSDGLNHMTYNRCIGTRYCANNCPYKVRRFNWYNYNRKADFKDINPTQSELGRMVLNPDVVVRSRGVMEKCSMCVQRIQDGKLKAKKEMRPLKDGEIKMACEAACATGAILFGDLNNPDSRITKSRGDERSYFVLEEVGIKPSVGYLTKVRNQEESINHEEHGGGHGEQGGHEAKGAHEEAAEGKAHAKEEAHH